MDLQISSDDDEIFLFERVVRHLQSVHGYSYNDSVRLVNEYYADFTDPSCCDEHSIPVQNFDFFSHIEAVSMADRVHYYRGLKNTPDEAAFVSWQRETRI